MNPFSLEAYALPEKFFLNCLVDEFLLSIFSISFFGDFHYSNVGALELSLKIVFINISSSLLHLLLFLLYFREIYSNLSSIFVPSFSFLPLYF